MAKQRPNTRWNAPRAARKGTIPYTVNVVRRGRSSSLQFVACAYGGKGEKSCAAGRNPRLALSKALVKLSRSVKKRRGAFRGLRK